MCILWAPKRIQGKAAARLYKFANQPAVACMHLSREGLTPMFEFAMRPVLMVSAKTMTPMALGILQVAGFPIKTLQICTRHAGVQPVQLRDLGKFCFQDSGLAWAS